MTNVYSEEARTAARELRARLKRDLAAGRFVSSGSTSARNPRTTVTESKSSANRAATTTRKG